MTKEEFKEKYFQRMNDYWKNNQTVPTEYAILMNDGAYTDFHLEITTEKGVNMSDAVIKCGSICRQAVFNGAIDGKKYTIDEIQATVFLMEMWLSETAEKTGLRPSQSKDRETIILFQYTDNILKEATHYLSANGELTEYDKDIVYFKNTN